MLNPDNVQNITNIEGWGLTLVAYKKIVVSYCDGAVLEIYLDHKFQWPQEGLSCESLAYEIVT